MDGFLAWSRWAAHDDLLHRWRRNDALPSRSREHARPSNPSAVTRRPLQAPEPLFFRVVMCLALAGALLVAYAAAAQPVLPCRAELARLCAHVTKGRGHLTQCLQQNTEQLPDNCRQHLRDVLAQLKETRQPCEDDLLLFCAGADLAEPRIVGCLHRNHGALTSACSHLTDLLQKTR